MALIQEDLPPDLFVSVPIVGAVGLYVPNRIIS
jgi:hypothetical protein